MMLGRRVDVSTREVVKFFPSNPPERGDIVLVEGVRCRVTYCRVKWDDRVWTIRSLRVKAAPA